MVTISSNSTATKIYLDGVLGYTGSAGIIPIKDTDYFIGAYQKVGNTFLQNFKGYIADFRIYHSVFSDTDIAKIIINKYRLSNIKLTLEELDPDNLDLLANVIAPINSSL